MSFHLISATDLFVKHKQLSWSSKQTLDLLTLNQIQNETIQTSFKTECYSGYLKENLRYIFVYLLYIISDLLSVLTDCPY